MGALTTTYMNNIRKISTVKRKSSGKNGSMRDSLSKEGLLRIPGARVLFSPFKNKDGSYATGLDENANYLRFMTPEQKEAELSVIRGLRDRAERFFGTIDLGPRAPFYTDVFKRFEQDNVCRTYHMKDGDNIFNLDNPWDLISYAWLRVHPSIAPSGTLVNTGEYSRCDYYVNDSDVETEQKYKLQKRISDAIGALTSMGVTRLRMIARQCGFSVTDVDKEEVVFTRMYDFINEATTAGKSVNLKMFESILGLTQEALDIRDTMEQGFIYGVFKNFKNAIYQGDNRIAANKEELLEKLSDFNNQDFLLNVAQELKIKRSQVHA